MLFEHFLKITLFEIINFSTHQTTDVPSALSLYHKSLLIDILFFHYPLFPQIPRLGNLTFHDFDRNNFSRGLRITTRRTTIHEELQSAPPMFLRETNFITLILTRTPSTIRPFAEQYPSHHRVIINPKLPFHPLLFPSSNPITFHDFDHNLCHAIQK